MSSEPIQAGRPPDVPLARLGRGAGALVLVGWLVVAAVAATIAWLAVPAGARDGAFWWRLGWFQVLWALVAATGYLAFVSSGSPDDLRARRGGVTPTLFLVAGGYAAVSLLAMALHALLPDGPAVDRAHLMAQLAVFALAAVAAVLLGIARVGARDAPTAVGAALPPASPPQALHDRLVALEANLPDALRGALGNELGRLRERLLHSLSPSAALLERADYQRLSEDVVALCDDVSRAVGVGDVVGPVAGDRMATWQATASALAARARDVAEGSVVR